MPHPLITAEDLRTALAQAVAVVAIPGCVVSQFYCDMSAEDAVRFLSANPYLDYADPFIVRQCTPRS